MCATFFANVNINYRLPIKVYYRICTLRHIRNGINIEKDKWKVISIKCWNNKILCKQHSDWKSFYRNILDNKVVKIICFCFEHQTKTLIMESLIVYRIHTKHKSVWYIHRLKISKWADWCHHINILRHGNIIENTTITLDILYIATICTNMVAVWNCPCWLKHFMCSVANWCQEKLQNILFV